MPGLQPSAGTDTRNTDLPAYMPGADRMRNTSQETTPTANLAHWQQRKTICTFIEEFYLKYATLQVPLMYFIHLTQVEYKLKV
jgi:hypothetical protein